jgi:hypothetical protein
MPLAICQQEVKPMKHKKVELIPSEEPLLLVVDPSLVFPQILKAILRRIGSEIESVAFQQTEIAAFWLTGEMDREKAEKYPFTSPWDAYPALRLPTIAIVSLGFPIEEQERIMDWLYVRSPTTKIITTSAEEELHNLDNYRDELYWRHVVSHLPKPVTVENVVERVVTVLQP